MLWNHRLPVIFPIVTIIGCTPKKNDTNKKNEHDLHLSTQPCHFKKMFDIESTRNNTFSNFDCSSNTLLKTTRMLLPRKTHRDQSMKIGFRWSF